MEKVLYRFIGLITIVILIGSLLSCSRPTVEPNKNYTGDYNVLEHMSTGVVLEYVIHIENVGQGITITGFLDTQDITLKGNTSNGITITTTEVIDKAGTEWDIVWHDTDIEHINYCIYGNGSYCSDMYLTKL